MAKQLKKGHVDSIVVRSLLWVDDSRKTNRFFWGLVIVGLILAALDLIYYKKVYFEFEHFFAFYALYGFFMCAVLIFATKVIRRFLQRDENYYAPFDVEVEDHPEHDLDRKEADV